MQNPKQLENYLKKNQWDAAYGWLQRELTVVKHKLICQRILHHTFGVMMSIVLAFFTWLVLFPSADEAELKAFPLATVVNKLFNRLGETVPGGKSVVIVGLIFIPCLVSLILALVFSFIKPVKRNSCNKKKEENSNVTQVKDKLELFKKLDAKYSGGPGKMVFYFLFAGVFTGGVMVFSSVPGGLNPFVYLVIAVICDIIYGVIFALFAYIFECLRRTTEVVVYPVYDWIKIVDRVIDKNKPTTSSYVPNSRNMENTLYYKEKFNEYYARYTGTDYETPEDYAKRIVREVEDDLSGKGYGDY